MRFSRLHTTVLVFTLLALAGSVLFFHAPIAYSQVTTAAIHGTVTDVSGAVVVNAKITALNTVTGISAVATSNQNGFYLFPALQIGGPYTITVEAQGFQRFESKGTMLTVNANLEVNAKLRVGTALQTVTVNAAVVQVETTNTQLEQIVPATQIANLPTLGRDAASLEKLAPGVVESSDRFGSFASNGSQTTENSYVLEGVDNNDGPLQSEGFVVNPDALAEENVVTSTINPEFARNGGAVINQVVKSGTNLIHGSGFEYYRDTFLNNGNYFSKTRPPFHRNIFGGTLGGPIFKDRLFAFVAYQGMRRKVGATQQTHVFQNGIMPSATSPGGIFTNENNVADGGPNGTVGLTANSIPFDILTGTGAQIGAGVDCGPSSTLYTTWNTCFPPGTPVVISTSSFNSIAKALAAKYVPAGNAGTATAPLYAFNTANTGASDQGILRADYHLSNKDQFSGTGIFQSAPATATLSFGGGNLPGFGSVQASHIKIFSASETHTFNASTLNVLRAGYWRLNFAAVEPAQVVTPASLGFAINPQSSSSGIPRIALTGLFGLGFSYEGPQPRKDANLTASDNFSRTFGNHSLKVGANVEQFRVSNPYYAYNNGYYYYSGGGTFTSGDPGLDYLLGIPDGFYQSSGGFIDAEAWEYYAFAQDSWRATSDLTLNYGLTWDVETPNQNNQFNGLGITCFQVSSKTSKIFTGGFPGLLFPGDPGCNKAGGATAHWAHFGPRVGFAWSPSHGPSALVGASGAHQFSIRGGFGLYYNRDQEEGQLQNLGDTPNFKLSLGAADFGGSPAFANPYVDVSGAGSETNPFPYVRPKPGAALDWSQYLEQDISAIDANYNTPYTYNFNLNVQRQLPSNMILQIGYVGSLGRKLPTVYEADPITAAGNAACAASATCQKYRAYQHLFYPSHAAQPATMYGYPDYLSVGTLATEGTSNYNSLQASLTKNVSHGLYFTAAYTFSHGLDNASGLESSGFNGLGTNQYQPNLSYGDSDYDARHRVVFSYDYEVPMVPSWKDNFAAKEILGEWHLTGMTALQTGFPITILDEGTYNSLWCDALSYYSCPDNPNTTTFHIPSQNPRAAGHYWFNGSLFYQEGATPTSSKVVNWGTFGNVKRNFFHGPGYNYTNLSLFKNFPIGSDKARSVQIMLQAANLFNHANFDSPDSNFTDGPYFGEVEYVVGSTTADGNGDPAPGRTVQLVGKITF
jgi:hypothetical protein